MVPKLVDVPDAPFIPGLSFRHFGGEGDYADMVEVLNAAKQADGVDQTDTVEGVANTYGHLTNCDPYQDMLIAEVDREMVAYGRVEWWEELDGKREYLLLGFLRPEWRRKRLGTAMLRWNENRLLQIAADHPPEVRKSFEAFCANGEKGAEALYRSEGYEPRWVDATMVRPDLEDIPEAPLPDGLEVRDVTSAQMRQIWEADNEAFRDHPGYSEPTEDRYQSFLGFPHQDPTLWRVAWDGDEVAGQVRSFINEAENDEWKRRRGYTEFISVRRPWRRRGLATALLCLSLEALKERGMEEVALGVHVDNPNGAYDLYESVGFRVTTTWTGFRKPLS